MLNLAVGDLVVYGAHGAGTVEAREIRGVNGDERAVVVVALAKSLFVQLPLALARKQLGSLVDEAGIATIGEVLRESPPVSGDSWLKPCRGCGSRLAPSERELVRRARAMLTAESGASQ